MPILRTRCTKRNW